MIRHLLPPKYSGASGGQYLSTKAFSSEMQWGFSISLIAHAVGIALIVFMSSLVKKPADLMVIDFTFMETPPAVSQKTETTHTLAPPPPIVAQQPVKKKEIAVSPQKPIPKPEAPKPRAVTTLSPRKTKKQLPPAVIEHKEPEPEPYHPPEPANIAQTPAKQPVPKEAVPSPPPVVSQNQRNVSNPDTVPHMQKTNVAPAPQPARNKQRALHKYRKANFAYIQKGIQQQIKYPRIARRMGWEGKVVVEFIICEDGQVTDVHIVESSGFSALDKNAVTTIKKAAPFPAPTFPAKLIVPVVYRLS